jgi:hypothetical protein
MNSATEYRTASQDLNYCIPCFFHCSSDAEDNRWQYERAHHHDCGKGTQKTHEKMSELNFFYKFEKLHY